MSCGLQFQLWSLAVFWCECFSGCSPPLGSLSQLFSCQLLSTSKAPGSPADTAGQDSSVVTKVFVINENVSFYHAKTNVFHVFIHSYHVCKCRGRRIERLSRNPEIGGSILTRAICPYKTWMMYDDSVSLLMTCLCSAPGLMSNISLQNVCEKLTLKDYSPPKRPGWPEETHIWLCTGNWTWLWIGDTHTPISSLWHKACVICFIYTWRHPCA